MSGDQCRYMAAAYPDLDAADTCDSLDHRHDEPTFALARALAVAVQQQSVATDEEVAWFLEDAAAVVDDFDPKPWAWSVTTPEPTDEPGLDFTLWINSRAYVIQPAEQEEARPVSRAEWERWVAEAED